MHAHEDNKIEIVNMQIISKLFSLNFFCTSIRVQQMQRVTSLLPKLLYHIHTALTQASVASAAFELHCLYNFIAPQQLLFDVAF